MRVFFSVGDPSGDVHTASVLRAIRALEPGVEFFGFGGRQMAEAGCELLYPLVEHPVIGVLEALKRVPFFRRLYRSLFDVFTRRRPDLVVLVDYPGFNWWVARAARAQGIPVLYFLAPQIWAWASWRVRKMRRLVDRVICAYPFEVDWFRRHGVDAVYLGHPYFDALRQVKPLAPPSAPTRRVVLLPGSRWSEVRRMSWPMVRAAGELQRRVRDVSFLAACATEEHAEFVRRCARRAGLEVGVVVGRTPEAIASATCCLAKSGSITMELLWFEKPAVIYYRVPRIEYGVYWFGLASGMARVRFISLPNLAAGRMVYPELVTWAEARQWLVEGLTRWLADEQALVAIRRELAHLKRLFDRPGATQATARHIVEFAARKREPRRAVA